MGSDIAQSLFIFLCYFSLGLAHNPIHTGLFWHLTDVHVDLDYEKHTCQGPLGDQKCDSPLSLWLSALNATRQVLHTAPDFVVFSGDSVTHGNIARDEFERTMETVASALRVVFPSENSNAQQRNSIPVIVTVGNHDVYPDNEMSVKTNDADRRRWCTRLGSSPRLWGDWVANAFDADVDRFNDGCFYSVRLRIGQTGQTLRIVSLNGLPYSLRNRQSNSSDPDPLGQFQWLTAQLQSALRQSQKVIVVMHFPLGAPENSPVDYRHLHDIYNQRLLNIFTEFADVVALGLFGHQHTDSFRFISSTSKEGTKSNPLIPLFNTPSISPMNLTNLGAFNPRVRVFNYSITSTSLHLNDFHQFRINLSNTPPFTKVPWSLEYSAIRAYNISDLSAQSLESLLTRLEVNHTLWCAYWNHELGGPDHSSGPCPKLHSSRHCRHICTMRHLHYTALDACLHDCDDASSLASARTSTDQVDSWNALPVVALVIVAFLAILFGVVLLANREMCRRGGRRGDRRGRRRRERGGGYLITYHQTALNASISGARRSAGEVELEEEKALNADIEDGAYDADASGEEEEVRKVNDVAKLSTSGRSGEGGGETYFSVHSSLERLCPSQPDHLDVSVEGDRPGAGSGRIWEDGVGKF
ncbi:Acid sphingomyelinase-like phosphodiesterase 3b [Taenia solium]|eukprot:TsM_000236500 transcript=TsM_000236500 gene=TsM_000236500